MVSFDVVSLYTKVPVEDAIRVLREITSDEIAKLVEICLKSTYFSFQGEIYEQVDGVAMGSPLSLIVANLYIEYLEKKSIDSSTLKSRDWKRYVDDTNIIWPHGRDSLDKFLTHLNNRSDQIKFTMEIQENNIH